MLLLLLLCRVTLVAADELDDSDVLGHGSRRPPALCGCAGRGSDQ